MFADHNEIIDVKSEEGKLPNYHSFFKSFERDEIYRNTEKKGRNEIEESATSRGREYYISPTMLIRTDSEVKVRTPDSRVFNSYYRKAMAKESTSRPVLKPFCLKGFDDSMYTEEKKPVRIVRRFKRKRIMKLSTQNIHNSKKEIKLKNRLVSILGEYSKIENQPVKAIIFEDLKDIPMKSNENFEFLENLSIKMCNTLQPSIQKVNNTIDFTKNSSQSLIFQIENEKNKLQNQKKSENQLKSKTINCPFCKKIFFKGASLGGHISKIHKGKSEVFKQKIHKRSERSLIRDRNYFLLQEILKWFN